MERAARIRGVAAMTGALALAMARGWAAAPEASLVLIEGRGDVEERLLVLPARAVAGLRFQTGRLDRLVPGASERVLRRFFSLEARGELAPPPELREVGLLFGQGGGAFRLGGAGMEAGIEAMLAGLGYRVLPEGAGRSFEARDAWARGEEGLAYGAWGRRLERLCLVGLDGWGRRIQRLEAPGRGEVLALWCRDGAESGLDLLPFLPPGLPPAPVPLRLAGVDVRTRGEGAPLAVRLRFVPRRGAAQASLEEWLRFAWTGPEEAEIGGRGPGVAVQWEEAPEVTGGRLAALVEALMEWVAGDRFRELQ